jgi:DNA-binding MarR family transcriptional regulator
MMAAPLSIASNIPQGVEVQLRRFYYDIAQIAYPAPIAAFAKVAEPSHILWGTDFPFRHGEEYVQRLPACGLSVSELRRIERENALPLFPRLRIDCRSPENEGVSQTRLSQISEIDPARLAGILDRLEAGGWAQRRRRPGDRRVRSLAVTENAKPVLELIGNVISDTYVEALRGVSIDEIGTMVKVLTRVHSNLSTCKPLGADPLDKGGNDITAPGRLRLVR